MVRTKEFIAGQPRRLTLSVVITIAYSTLASFTHPFTYSADVIAGLPIAVAAVGVALRLRSSESHRPFPFLHPNAKGGDGLRRWDLMWVTVTALVFSWEIYCFTSAPRSAHPTLSELINMADSSRPGKAVVFALWLGLGGYLVLR